MTGPTIRSRKFNSPAIALAFALGLVASSGLAAPLPKLPVIQNVGIVPVQWEGSAAEVDDAKELFDQAFPEAVRDARRFRVLSDDLVESLWQGADGRAELRDEFEMQGLVSLTVSPRGDVAQLTVRLMDGLLKTNLLETDTVKTSWMRSASASSVANRLERLVFRLFNRLPVDVSVTSVQGAYITLSGGAEQGIEAGDQVDLVRAEVSSLHPANGTWHEFRKSPLGVAKVIEVKGFTSVAQLTRQLKDGAVEVGDGARIPAIASRVKFARQAGDQEFRDAGEQATIIVPPLYQGETPNPAAPTPPRAPTMPPERQGQMFDPPPQEPASPETEPATPAVAAPAEDRGPTIWDQFKDEATSHRVIDEITAYAGPYWWSMKGPGNINSSGKFPLWLLNSAGGGVTRTMFYKIKGDFGGGVVFGKTPASSYFGYDFYSRGYWEDELLLGQGLIKTWRAGGVGTFSGMSVPQGGYGGGDWLRIGFFGGLGGTVLAEGARYDWFGDFTLLPMNIGRVGYDGSYKTVESAFGTSISVGAYRFEPPRVIQWGGGIEVTDERMTLKNSRRPHSTEYTIKLLAKYGL